MQRNATKIDGISALQAKAIQCLLTEPTITKAAKKAKINRYAQRYKNEQLLVIEQGRKDIGMKDKSTVYVTGTIHREPKFSKLENGVPVCEILVLSLKQWKDAGRMHDDELLIDCVAFGHAANSLRKRAEAGTRVCVEGIFGREHYQQAGEERSRLVVVVETISYITGLKTEKAAFVPQKCGNNYDHGNFSK